MIIEHISVSREQLWEKCQQAYKYRYHLKIPTKETPFHFTFGKIVHRIIEDYTKNLGNKSINECKKDILDGKLFLENETIAPKLDLPSINRLNLHLRNYEKLHDKIGFLGESEYGFSFDLSPPDKKLIVGFIDRLIVKDDSIFIIDYKTSKNNGWRKTSDNIISDLQLQCYCWIARETFKIPASKIMASLYYLEDAITVPVRFSEKTLDCFPEKMLSIYNQIVAKNPDTVNGNVGQHCNYCEYKNICPFFNNYSKKSSPLYKNPLQ